MRSVINLADTLVTTALPYVCALLWPFSYLHQLSRRAQPRKRVLLVARNSIAADHMLCIHDLLIRDENIIQFVTADRVPAREFTKNDAANIIGGKPLHILSALMRHWDLIVFTNHPFGFGLCFAPWLKKLYINHGIHSGKINNDRAQDGVYGSGKIIRPFRKPYYDCMFAASFWERDFAINETPALQSHVKTVGFLRADLFIKCIEESGSAARRKLGLSPNKPVIHIISTWGPNSLYATAGKWILQQVEELQDDYEFVVSIHPRFDYLGKGSIERRDAIFTRFEEVGAKANRGLDWEDYVAASDVAISDHSSLSLYHVLARHPLLLVDINRDQYVEGSTFDLLAKLCGKLSEYPCLADAIQDALKHAPYEHGSIVNQMIDYQGSAEERYRQEINALMD